MFFNRVKTFVLLVALSLLLIFLGNLFGGRAGMQFAFVFALIMNGVAYFFSDKIVLKLYRAQTLDPIQYSCIYNTVEELTQTMSIPMPKLWIIDSPMANAFATGRNPKHASIAVTSGIIGILDKDELRGVLAHELAHIKNRDVLVATIAATIATTISYLASMLRFAAFWGGGNRRRNSSPIVMILVSILMPIAALLIQLAISRSREYLADETGAHYSNDPLALASALEKLHHTAKYRSSQTQSAGKESTAHMFIVHPFASEGFMSLFSTHPPIEKRIEKLRNMYENL